MPDGPAKLPGVAFTPLLPLLIDRQNLEVEKMPAGTHLAMIPTGGPGYSRKWASPTHVLQQGVFPYCLHQALGVHVAQAQDVEGTAIWEGRQTEDSSIQGWIKAAPCSSPLGLLFRRRPQMGSTGAPSVPESLISACSRRGANISDLGPRYGSAAKAYALHVEDQSLIPDTVQARAEPYSSGPQH